MRRDALGMTLGKDEMDFILEFIPLYRSMTADNRKAVMAFAKGMEYQQELQVMAKAAKKA